VGGRPASAWAGNRIAKRLTSLRLP
jgi:hypothetical protein